jgi:hypothetical protein
LYFSIKTDKNLCDIATSTTAPTGTSSAAADACAAQPIEDYNMGLRVGSIFIILVTSALGTYGPIVLHRIKPYKQGDIRDWILTVGKFCKYFINIQI